MKIRRPHIAIVLSVLFPGFGQLYNRQFNKGIFYIAFKFVINLLRREPLEILLEAKKAGNILVDNSIVLIVVAYTIADIILLIHCIIDAKKNAEEIESKMLDNTDEK
ncbi:MAG: hypothetical protein GWO07_11330 [Candidatus Dadabacteria bacterium]|nr:hypothetical protein [Candidatus Dadabacteria bacterium]NIS09331.1 hypothetical protein [Candidatus Dadabacteria bacterium]NIV42246.1 hypothetical protein [Candidatus Dadabacteria bacterium]NIY22577.1 hypothetical protein [Candidatus Dadabacteria bacterium]